MFMLYIERTAENLNNNIRLLFRTQRELIDYMKLNFIENDLLCRDIGCQYKLEFSISSGDIEKFSTLELEYVYAMYDTEYVFNINPEPLGKVNFVEIIYTDEELIDKLGIKRYERMKKLGWLDSPESKDYTPHIDQELHDIIIESKTMIEFNNNGV